MRLALVHDYLKEFGGAERVLMALHEIWPRAPIYTAFCLKNSTAGRAFKKAKIIESKFAPLIKYKNLYSPLRFLTPWIWKSFDLSGYDLVISSASWFITRGFKIGLKTKVFCYCHTPPRWLYGYPTSVEWQRYWPIKVYGQLVAHFLRLDDFRTAQEVDEFMVNSENVRRRVKKFYRREATIIYPPVAVKKIKQLTKNLRVKDYYLIVSRVVGAKGIELAIKAARKARVKLKIAGEPAGMVWLRRRLEKLQTKGVEFLGRLKDEELYHYYGQGKALLALAEEEDFGITPVEAMAAGRPVIAFRGGGYLESVIEGKTGVFIEQLSVEKLTKILKSFNPKIFKSEDCRRQAEKFSQERFKKEIKAFIQEKR
jgi:glycosyltransferase involved in cell wall biosynthesis